MTDPRPHLEFRGISAFHGSKQVLRDVSLNIGRNSLIGIIGPANSGKTTLLKSINGTLDFIGGARFTGELLINCKRAAATPAPNQLPPRIWTAFPLPGGLPPTTYETGAS